MSKIKLSVLLAFLIVAFGTACSGAQPSPVTTPPPPLARPAAMTVVPQAVAQAEASPTSTGAPNPLADAVAKTQKAKVYRAMEDFSGSAVILLGPGKGTDPVTIMRSEAEFNGADFHAKIRGSMVALFGADEAKGFDFTLVNGKTYVRGPAPLFGADEAKWYALGDDAGITLNVSPAPTLDRVASATNNWARFSKTRSGDSLDDQKCDLYTAGTDAAADVFATFMKGLPSADRALIVDQGAVSAFVCTDGYVHNLVADFTVHDKANPEAKGTAKYGLDLFAFDGAISVTAPLDPTPLGNAGKATATPTPAGPKPIGGGNQPANYDGQWEGKTSDESYVSFGVQDGQVTYLNLGYFVSSGSCSMSGNYGTSVENAVIQNKALSINIKDSDDNQYVFTATFTSTREAGGTLEVKATSQTCGAIAVISTWTATHTPEETPTPEPTPTEPLVAPTPKNPGPPVNATPSSRTETGAGAVVTALFDKLNARNVDAALSLFGDSIVTWGSTVAMDEDELVQLLTERTSRGVTYQVTNVKVVGNTIVNFTLQESGGGSATYPNCLAMLDGNKISILTID